MFLRNFNKRCLPIKLAKKLSGMCVTQPHKVPTSNLMKQNLQSFSIILPGRDLRQNNCVHRGICRPSMIHL